MRYSEVVGSFEEIASTKKRLEITDHLVALFAKTPKESLPLVVYLLAGELRPKYEGVVLGLAEKLVIGAVHEVTGLPVKEIEEAYVKRGDIGRCTEDALERKKQRTLFSEPLTIERVYNTMLKVAKTSGSRSQEARSEMSNRIEFSALTIDQLPSKSLRHHSAVLRSLMLSSSQRQLLLFPQTVLAYHRTRGDLHRTFPDRVPCCTQLEDPSRQAEAPEASQGIQRGEPTALPECFKNGGALGHSSILFGFTSY